jgi:hypothetical protein
MAFDTQIMETGFSDNLFLAFKLLSFLKLARRHPSTYARYTSIEGTTYAFLTYCDKQGSERGTSKISNRNREHVMRLATSPNLFIFILSLSPPLFFPTGCIHNHTPRAPNGRVPSYLYSFRLKA